MQQFVQYSIPDKNNGPQLHTLHISSACINAQTDASLEPTIFSLSNAHLHRVAAKKVHERKS